MAKKVLPPSSALSQPSSFSEYLDTLFSLQEALHTAGGKMVTADDIRDMSVHELIGLIAPNNIRFVHYPNLNIK